ncbi:hypothetical protein P7C73_g6350, partial [Tremellales sp. Uapishka_1]
MDISHLSLQADIASRAKLAYDSVNLSTDQNTFLHHHATSDTYECDEPTSNGSAASLPNPHQASPVSSVPTLPSPLPFPIFEPPSGTTDLGILEKERGRDVNWLKNRWGKARAMREEVDGKSESGPERLTQIKRRELVVIKKLCVEYAKDRGSGDADEAWEKRVELLRVLGGLERRLAVARAEMQCIERAIGSTASVETTHDFKERIFPTPTPCQACNQIIWIKAEKSCRNCGIAAHAKCELHVEMTCSGDPEGRRDRRKSFKHLPTGKDFRKSFAGHGHRILRRRSNSNEPNGHVQIYIETEPSAVETDNLPDQDLHVSPYIPPDVYRATSEVSPSRSRPLPSTPDTPIYTPHSETAPHLGFAWVKFDYTAKMGWDLSVTRGDVVKILELERDGWIMVRLGVQEGTKEGLVPASFLGLGNDGIGTGRYVVALFDFTPRDGDHAQLEQHQVYELSPIGSEFDEFWTEILVPDQSGMMREGAIVPSSYEILSLSVSPSYPHVFASSSKDKSIRLWNFLGRDPAPSPSSKLSENYPQGMAEEGDVIIAILAGDGSGGHQSDVISVAFHPTRDAVASAGADRAVKIWPLPPLPKPQTGHAPRGYRPLLICKPLFSTSRLHDSKVDTIAWLSEDILVSKSINQMITWRWLRSESLLTKDRPLGDRPHETLNYVAGIEYLDSHSFAILARYQIDAPYWYMRFGVYHGYTSDFSDPENATGSLIALGVPSRVPRIAIFNPALAQDSSPSPFETQLRRSSLDGLSSRDRYMTPPAMFPARPNPSLKPWTLDATYWATLMKALKIPPKAYQLESGMIQHVAISPRGAKWIVGVGHAETILVFRAVDAGKVGASH